MSAISTTLEKLSVGQTTAHNNMAWFPLLDAASPAADYLTLDEALNQGHARVTEVDEGGSVPELMFSNESARRVLLLDGEELVGAKQNRVLNITILVGAGQKLTIPVSCVEEGRWGYRSRDFSSADRAMYARGRARKMSQVSASLRERGERHADQHDVWDGVASMARCLSVESSTEAMADAYEQSAESLASYTDGIQTRRAPGRRGVLSRWQGRRHRAVRQRRYLRQDRRQTRRKLRDGCARRAGEDGREE